MSVSQALEQFAKDLHALIAGATTAGVYEGEAPRGSDGSVLTGAYPFAVYTVNVMAPETELGAYTATVMVDVWAAGSWAGAYKVAGEIHEALDGFVGVMPCGRVSVDASGIAMSRQARDPHDERVRRISSQYSATLYPKINQEA